MEEEKIKSDLEISKEFDRKLTERIGETSSQTSLLDKGRITISTTISGHFWTLAKSNNIGWSEGLRVGISILLAEKGLVQYDNKLNIWRKMNLFRAKAEEALHKIDELTEELARREGVKIEKKTSK